MKTKNQSKLSDKSKTSALLLCMFLGTIGAHQFYVGKVARGMIMLLLSLTIIGLFITSLWALVDMVTIITGKFTDDEGKKIA